MRGSQTLTDYILQYTVDVKNSHNKAFNRESLKGKLCLSYLVNHRIFPHRNIFGPVLGSSPAQNPPVLPSMQSGFGGNLYNTSFSAKRHFLKHSNTESHSCVLLSCSIHKSLCCWSRCPRNGHQPLSDQW